MSRLNCIEEAYLLVHGDEIHDFGKSDSDTLARLRNENRGIQELDAKGGTLMPGWIDSHTHIVFAGSREKEFTDRIKGLSYEEIALRGGGILNSAERLRKASEPELLESAARRLKEVAMLGTVALEIKSGYGLSPESELKMLRVIKKLAESGPLAIRSTFLGAHAVPSEFKGNKKEYISVLIREVMPEIQKHGLAEFCDVFCEQNYFSADETKEILEAAKAHGMLPKVHAEQLSHSGGIKAGIMSGAVSVDHLEFANEEDIRMLADSETIPVVLPGAQFFLGLKNPPVRKMIEAGCAVALSSDYNPGSCPSGNMNQMVSLACIMYKMTPDEAIIAATTNSARAIGLSEKYGSICRGKKASFFITQAIPTYNFLPYAFGSNLIDTVVINGKSVSKNELYKF